MTDTPYLGLPLIEASQAQKHVTHNEALALLDMIVQLAVASRALTAPPSTPEEGDRYIVKATGTGAFAGKDNQIAHYAGGSWLFVPPRTGWLAFVADEGALLAWDGSAWVSAVSSSGDITSLQDLSLLGVGTTADSTNPFSAKLNNALWVAKTVGEGGDGTLRYKLSKENASKNLSFLFQDNFSGRAEIGLTGDDDFHFKVSPDGSAWIDAIVIDKTTGAAKLNAGLFLTGDISPAQITADQNDYNPTGLSTASALRLSSDASRNVTGLSGGGDGRIVAITNVGANDIVLKDASTSSSAANRFAFGADVTLGAKQGALLWYDSTDSRWTLLAAPQASAGGGGTVPISQGGTGGTTASAARTNLGLGSAATLDVGTSANKVVQLDGSAKLPAVDGSQLTNLPGGGGSVPADLDLLLAELALGLADALNVAQFLGSAGNRFADSFDALTHVDTAGATNLDSGTAGQLKPSSSTTTTFSQTVDANSVGNYQGYGARVVIPASSISSNGTNVRIRLAPRSSGNTIITDCFIGEKAGSGDAYDFATTPTRITFNGGSNGVTVTGGGAAVLSDVVTFSIDETKSYVISFGLSGSQDGIALKSGTAPDSYYKAAAAGEAGTVNVSGYTLESGFTYIVNRIEVNIGANNLTVKSNALTAASAPASVKVVARVAEPDSITLNTDLILAVSRDGGATFTNATMSDLFTANAIHVLQSAAIDVSGQPSGASVKWKITTANNKMVEIHDMYVYWS